MERHHLLSHTLLVLLFLFLVIVIVMVEPSQAAKEKKKRAKLFSFYMHNTLRNFSSEKFSAIVTSQPPNVGATGPQFNQFGMMTTFEDPITLNGSAGSKRLGTGQGFYLYDSQRVHVMFMVFTAVIDSGKYKGTIDIIGQNPTDRAGYRYLSVVGGTGDFLLARGLAKLLFMGATRNPTDHQVTWVVSFDLQLRY